MIVNGTKDNFAEEVKEGVVLVDFWAEWCMPCKMLLPILEELSNEGHKIVKVNTEKQYELVSSHSIFSLPTLVVYKDGQIIDQQIGLKQKEQIEKMLSK